MIKSFRNKALERLFARGEPKGLPADSIERIRVILLALQAAETLNDLEGLKRLRLHQLKGELKGFWAVNVTGNYRIVFRLVPPDVFDVDYLDYH